MALVRSISCFFPRPLRFATVLLYSIKKILGVSGKPQYRPYHHTSSLKCIYGKFFWLINEAESAGETCWLLDDDEMESKDDVDVDEDEEHDAVDSVFVLVLESVKLG